MRIAYGCLAASALGLLLTGLAAAQTRSDLDTKTWVKEHDKNADGALDREEFFQAVVEAFYFRDKYKTGYLAIEELKEASPEMLSAVKRKDRDKLSLQEYVNAMFRDFEAADTDKDGLLTVEEIDVYIRTVK
jgi:Ca2+-binding EF-hand superfamily protein